MKILLTGGSGFLGRHVREALAGVHEVVAPSHAELDVTDAAAVESFLRRTRVDVVVHGAVKGDADVLETTLRGYWNLARCPALYDRIVTFGSGAEYGKHRDLVKVREEEIGREVPRDPYGFAKLLVNDRTRSSEKALNLRLFGVYGPGEKYLFRFLSNSVVKALLGIPIRVRQDAVFDYLWIGDLMQVVRAAVEEGCPVRDVNVTPTVSIALSEALALIERILGRRLDVSFETPGRNFEYTGSNARLRAWLPGLAFTGYEEGLRRLVEYHRERLSAIDVEAVVSDEYRARARTRGESERTGT